MTLEVRHHRKAAQRPGGDTAVVILVCLSVAVCLTADLVVHRQDVIAHARTADIASCFFTGG